MKQFILVIRGPSGSGKTTLSKSVQEKVGEKVAHLKADYFYWKVCPQDNDKHLDENKVVYENLLDLAENYLAAGYSVIIDGLLNRIDDYNMEEGLENLSKKFNVQYKRIFLNVNLETAKIRYAENNFSVPIEEVEGWTKGREMKIGPKDFIVDTIEKTPKQILDIVFKSL